MALSRSRFHPHTCHRVSFLDCDLVYICWVSLCNCPVSIYQSFPAKGAQTELSPIWYPLVVYLRFLIIRLTRSLDVVDRVVLRLLGCLLQPRPRSTSSRRHTSSHSGRRVRRPQTCGLSFCLAYCLLLTLHTPGRYIPEECGVMHARPGALCAASARISTVRVSM